MSQFPWYLVIFIALSELPFSHAAEPNEALKVAANEKADATTRATAISKLTSIPFTETKSLFTQCLGVRQPLPVQMAALQALTHYDSADVPSVLFGAWPSMTPKTRKLAMETLLAKPAWVGVVLDAIEKKQVLITDLEPAQIQTLQKSSDDKIRGRSAKLFSDSPLSQKEELLRKYRPTLKLKGDITKGKALFQESCVSCHKLEGTGEVVGPDLRLLKKRDSDSLLMSILDPNREVLSKYYAYLLVTDEETIFSGMIGGETALTVTILTSDGKSEIVQRANIQKLLSTGISAMPEGLEEKIDLQGMADLLAFLHSIR